MSISNKSIVYNAACDLEKTIQDFLAGKIDQEEMEWGMERRIKKYLIPYILWTKEHRHEEK